jgi:MATE family multidrug resistance protein
MVRLATPIALAEVGWMTMGIADTIVVGHLPNSAAAIGAVSLGSIVFYTVAIFGSGLLLGLDTLVSQAFGARRLDECHRSLINSLWFCLPLAPVLMAVLWGTLPLLEHGGIDRGVRKETVPYLEALIWSTPPLLVYFALRRYLQGMNLTRPVMLALVTANVVNVLGNVAFVFGRWGAARFGTQGSGWATCVSRCYLAAVLAGFAAWHSWRHRTGLFALDWRPHFGRIGALVRLGLPAASQIGLETAVFAVAAFLIGRLGAAPLAGHQIAMTTVSFTYMAPLGIGSAAAVRVGQALGRRDPQGAEHAGWVALGLGVGFMSLSALILLLFPERIALLYSVDPAVIRMGARLVSIAAFFQIFDGLQVVATGALRGAGDTHTAMFCHLAGYWGVGLPLGWLLCFRAGFGAPGLWAGLSVAIISIGLALLTFWKRKSARFGFAADTPSAALDGENGDSIP